MTHHCCEDTAAVTLLTVCVRVSWDVMCHEMSRTASRSEYESRREGSIENGYRSAFSAIGVTTNGVVMSSHIYYAEAAFLADLAICKAGL